MKKLKEKTYTQNQKSARKRHAFDFYPPRMDEKTIPIAIGIEQKIQNNHISKTEKGQCMNIDLKLNIPSIYSLNKKEVCL